MSQTAADGGRSDESYAASVSGQVGRTLSLSAVFVLGIDVGGLARDYLPGVVRAIAIIAVFWLLTVLVRRLLAKREAGITRQLGYMLPKVIWVIGGIILLGTFGINITSLMALLATVGIGLALIFTPVGQNAFAGFLAGIDNTASEGDVIAVGDKVGTVVRRGTLSTGVEFPDGSMVYMPNTSLIDDELTNHNRVDGARLQVEIKLDGSPDRQAAVEIMKTALEGLEWRRQDKPTTVLFTEVGANAFHYTCLAWVDRRLEEPQRTSDMLTALVDAL